MQRKVTKKKSVDEYINNAEASKADKSSIWDRKKDFKRGTTLSLYYQLWQRFKKAVDENEEDKNASDLFNDFMESYMRKFNN